MPLIAVNATSLEWAAVLAYCEARKAELQDDLLSLTSSDQARRDAAVRLNELNMLLSAPADTAQAVELQLQGEATARSVY